MTGPEPETLRAGNADREQVVTQLHKAFEEGRLDVTELDERIAAAYRAKTMGELVPLTADLPAARTPARLSAPVPARPAVDRDVERHSRRAALAGTFGLFLFNVLVWAAVSIGSGDAVYFWPIWTAIPFVLAVVGTIVGGGRRAD